MNRALLPVVDVCIHFLPISGVQFVFFLGYVPKINRFPTIHITWLDSPSFVKDCLKITDWLVWNHGILWLSIYWESPSQLDFHIFQRGKYTTNQIRYSQIWMLIVKSPMKSCPKMVPYDSVSWTNPWKLVGPIARHLQNPVKLLVLGPSFLGSHPITEIRTYRGTASSGKPRWGIHPTKGGKPTGSVWLNQ